LKNFFSIREILETYHPEVLRLFLLSNHYRSPVDYSEQNLTEAKVGLDRFYSVLRALDEITALDKGAAAQSLGEKRLAAELQEFPEKFTAAMDDDFNTAAALGHLYTLTRSLNAIADQKKKFPTFQIAEGTFQQAKEVFKMVGSVFGLFQEPAQAYFQKQKEKGLAAATVSPEEIEQLIKDRELARKSKDFKKADEIRKQLEDKGILLKDTPKGTEWIIKEG
jgi:cysteinyl-tRNA synthetase